MHHFTHFRSSLLVRTLAALLLLALFGLAPVQSTFAATITVNDTADNLTASDGLCTLREAIRNANSDSDTTGGDCVGGSGADIITLPSGTYTLSLVGRLEDANATGDLDITSSLTVNGSGSSTTIIDANDIDRVLDVQASTTVVINNVTIQNGDANQTSSDGSPGTTGEDGGGVRANGGSISLTINDSRVTSSHAYDEGGGLIVNTSGTTITLNNSLIDNNSASGSTTDNGGGLSAWPAGNITANNTTISNNSSGSSGHGGAAFAQGGVITLNYATITGNSDPSGGNAGLAAAIGGTFVLMSSIVSNNNPTDCTTFGGFGVITSNGYNVVGSSGSANGCPSGGTGDQILAGAIGTLLNTTLANNGGPTDTHALVSGSVAVDQIPNGTNGCGTTYTTDQRGITRPQNSTCDKGAYELVTAVSPGVGGGDGPGGVGIADGANSLRLWLRPDQGITVSPVATWNDQSGYNNHATQATAASRPVWQSAVWNNQPSVRFDGANDLLELPFILNPTNVDGYTLVLVNQIADLSTHRTFVQQMGTTGRGLLGSLPTPNFSYYSFLGNGWRVASTVLSTNTPYLVTSTWTGGTLPGTLIIYLNQAVDGTFALTAESATGTWRLGANKASALFLNGDMGDVIVYQDVLNELERILVDNYLSSKYAIVLPISANDHYDGDTVGNGDFDQDVAGIGQFGGNTHTQAHSSGMIVVDDNFLNDNGDWLLFGHRTTTNANSTADLPVAGDWATAPAPQRWERHFYIDVTDDTTTVNCSTPGTCFVDIIFDYSDGGMDADPGSMPGGPVSNYRLLRRSGTSGQFSDIATATAIVGDQVHFQGVDVSLLGSNFTLGSLDDGVSPTAVSLQTISSNIGVIPTFVVGLLLLTLVGTSLLVLRRKQTMR